MAVGFENPYVDTLVPKTAEALVVPVKGDAKDKYRGIVIARKDSNLSSLADLKGKAATR